MPNLARPPAIASVPLKSNHMIASNFVRRYVVLAVSRHQIKAPLSTQNAVPFAEQLERPADKRERRFLFRKHASTHGASSGVQQMRVIEERRDEELTPRRRRTTL